MMSRQDRASRSGRGLPAGWWILGGTIAILLLVLWLIPRQRNLIATIDQAHRWNQQEAPPRRQIVWQPAEQVAPVAAAVRDGDSLIRPQLTDHGTTLYFTRRDQDGSKDIYRSRLIDGRWQEAQPVVELNTQHDDIGPVIQADGQTLYLYSDRPGGQGGFDLYVAQRQKDGKWSAPTNLGTSLNSPAHEYDPAIATDGKTLYFASNRSARMQRLLSEGKLGAPADVWRSTLRADLGLNKFDLYVARRVNASADWQVSEPLDSLNDPDSNEGAPLVTANGAFLYFVSDRAARSHEEVNFDIYRVRIRGGTLGQVANLGSGVNTAANEIEPALSVEGFRIFFSRNGPTSSSATNGQEDQYSLFASTAIEIEEVAHWDGSNWQALVTTVSSFIATNWWWLLLAGLILALLLALRWYLKQVSLRRATIPTFLLCALLLHCLLALGTFYVTFVHQILVKQRSAADVVVAMSLDSQVEPSSQQVSKEVYEKVADLPSVERVEPTPVERQNTPAPDLVVEMEASRPNVPLSPNQQQLDSQVIKATLPRPQHRPPKPLVRRVTRTVSHDVAEPVPLETAFPTKRAPEEPKIEQAVNVIPATTPPSPQVPIPQLSVLQANRLTQLEREPRLAIEASVRASTSMTPPETKASRQLPSRRPTRVASSENELSIVETEKIAAESKPVQAAPTATQVTLDKSAPPDPDPSFSAPPTPANDADRPTSKLEWAETPRPQPIGDLALSAVRPLKLPATRRSASQDLEHQTLAVQLVELARVRKPTSTAMPELDLISAGSQSEVQIQRQSVSPASAHFSSKALERSRQPAELPTRLEAHALNRITSSPAVQPRARRIARRRLQTPGLAIAEDNIGLQALLRLRQSDKEAKKDLIKAFGGADKTLISIRRGLEWLRRHQFEDGHWSFNEFEKRCETQCKGKCGGHGSVRSDTGATGFALLPFLGDGHTHLTGDYRDAVRRGLQWLMENQKKDGDLCRGNEGNARMYSHGIATIALCEAYALTKDAELQNHAQRAIDFIVKAQHTSSGGWRYNPRQDGDTSVVGWQVMALKSGQMAGLEVPGETLAKTQDWFQRVGGKGKNLGRFGYTRHDFKPAMTAEALLCLQYLGADRHDERLRAGAEHLLKNLPKKNRENSYYWYYGTQFMFHMQGDYWARWNASLNRMLVDTQHEREQRQGTWDPKDQWERSGGRIYATSIRLLMLEVYYRHLPLYQVLQE